MKTSYQLSAVGGRLRVFLLAFGFLGCAWHSAQGQTAAGGGVQSPFGLGGSARALGMGNSAVAVMGDGDSFFENPASLATLNQHEILTFHAPLFLDAIYDSIGYFNPVGSHDSFGLAAARLGVTGILQTQNNIQAVSTISSEQLQGLVGYGFRASDDFDFGATVKYIHEQLGTYQGSGVGVDLGLLYHFSNKPEDFSQFSYRNITLGLSVSNVLQPETKLFQATSSPARIYRPALSYLYRLPSSRDELWLTAEGEVPESGGNILARGGIEYDWNDLLSGRVGFDGVSPTAGVGLRIDHFEFDYAFNQRDLGPLHRFSLTYRFGRYTDPLQAQKIEMLKWVARSYTQTNDYDPAIKAWQNVLKEFSNDEESAKAIQDLKRKRKNAVQDLLQLARSAINRGDHERALPLIAKVMVLDPGNPEAKELLKQVDKKGFKDTNYTRGVEAYSREDYGMAVQYLQMVYEVDPHYRDVDFLYHDAESHYLPLESMSKELTALYATGVNYYMGGEYQKAIDVWEQVLEQNPKNFLVRRNIDEAKNRLKDKAGPGGPTTLK